MLWILFVILLLALLWLFCSLPHLPTRSMSDFEGWDYAHRGLWDAYRPENSLTAFRRAVQSGFGIELDVQLTTDGELAVFHDDSLDRMCGVRKLLSDCTLAELRGYPLLDTPETIPTLPEVLRTVDGAVPLIVELKQGPRSKELCRKVDLLLQRYPGTACIESFDPRIVRWFRKNRPQRIRGQLTAFPTRRSVCSKSPKTLLLGLMVCNVLSRPDFVAQEAATDRNPFFRAMHLLGAHTVAWTVRSQAQMDSLRSRYDLQIFDSFVPGENATDEVEREPSET
ncbi:MAG: glycerophosphodiester phosphodiesterase [Clostridia bacterium]|nr:glycerophosphodiester phosphodiesterase [Clostridia bacterium]